MPDFKDYNGTRAASFFLSGVLRVKPDHLSHPTTPARMETLRAIAAARATGRPSPSLKGLSRALGIGVPSTWARMDHLVSEGLLVRLPGHQGVDLTAAGWLAVGMTPPASNAPIADAVREAFAAGEPLPARVLAALEVVA